jgi:serine/threonine protein phosphatase 1
VDKVFEELHSIRNRIILLGNHDEWALGWFLTGNAPSIWLTQGGDNTCRSYPDIIPPHHIEMLSTARLYYILDNKLFVHGGYIPGKDIELQDKHILLWDRTLILSAIKRRYSGEKTRLIDFDEVYVGHTPTLNFNELKPITACGVCLMDTGAGWPGGVLTILDIDSKEYYQSEPVDRLYPGIRGRR